MVDQLDDTFAMLVIVCDWPMCWSCVASTVVDHLDDTFTMHWSDHVYYFNPLLKGCISTARHTHTSVSVVAFCIFNRIKLVN